MISSNEYVFYIEGKGDICIFIGKLGKLLIDRQHGRGIMMEERQTCIICNQQRRDMLQLLQQPICTICEQDIVHVQVMDEEYDFYLARLKEIW